MRLSDKTQSTVSAYIQEHGEKALLDILKPPQEVSADVLTIIGDETLHRIPDNQRIGTVYIFSSGKIDDTSNSSVKAHIAHCLEQLFEVLKSKNWRRVRIVVSGHALLSMHIKLLVYRVLHLESEDIGYFGEQGYRSIKIDLRQDIL